MTPGPQALAARRTSPVISTRKVSFFIFSPHVCLWPTAARQGTRPGPMRYEEQVGRNNLPTRHQQQLSSYSRIVYVQTYWSQSSNENGLISWRTRPANSPSSQIALAVRLSKKAAASEKVIA